MIFDIRGPILEVNSLIFDEIILGISLNNLSEIIVIP